MLHEMTTLKVLGILLVVSGHVGGVFNILGIPWLNNAELFPAYSFHMPLFFFVSGYFYKVAHEKDIFNLVKKRFKSLVIPYYKCNLFYGILVSVLIYLNLFDKGSIINLYNFFITPWISGYQYNLNGPAWFVLCLFLTQIFYTTSRKFLSTYIDKISLSKEIAYTIVYTSLGILSTYISTTYNVLDNSLIYMLSRTLFSVTFFHIGFIYSSFIKDNINLNFRTFALLIVCKLIFIDTFGNYTFSMRALVFRDHFIQPIVTSLFGIIYSLHIAKFIGIVIDKFNLNKIKSTLNFVGSNTWSIMMHHMLCNYIIVLLYNNLGFDLSFGLDRFFKYFILPILCTVIPLLVPIYLNSNKIKISLPKYITHSFGKFFSNKVS